MNEWMNGEKKIFKTRDRDQLYRSLKWKRYDFFLFVCCILFGVCGVRVFFCESNSILYSQVTKKKINSKQSNGIEEPTSFEEKKNIFKNAFGFSLLLLALRILQKRKISWAQSFTLVFFHMDRVLLTTHTIHPQKKEVMKRERERERERGGENHQKNASTSFLLFWILQVS